MVVVGCGEVGEQGVTIVHDDALTVEQVVQVDSAHVVRVDVNAEFIGDVVHVFFTDELVIDAEAATVLEDAVEVAGAHQATMLVPVATMRSVVVVILVVFMVQIMMIMVVMVVMIVVMMIVTKVLNYNRVTRADLEAISLHALPKEDLNGLLVTDLNARLHVQAVTSPEVIKVRHADPLRRGLCVIKVLSPQLNALVVLHVVL